MENMSMFSNNHLVEQLISRLKIEFNLLDKSGIYGYTQYTMAYNSNKIEGSRLSEKHTSYLFNTMSLYGEDDVFRSKDIEEAQGHFLMFNHAIKTLDQSLNQELICAYHYQLKSGVFEDKANGYAIGAYKTRRNIIYDVKTSLPEEVPDKIEELLSYYSTSDVTIESLADFHYRYETIHPFQDGNGRTGRLILYRECLKNGIMPIIIRNDSKDIYMNALNVAQKSGDITKLVKCFEEEQKWYEEKVKYFLGV